MDDRGRRRRRRWRQLVGTAAIVAAGGVLVSACSTSPPASSVASLPSRGGATTTTALTTQAADQAMINFAHCLRNHGLASEPDPTHVAGHTGLSLEVPARTSSTSDALDACDHFIDTLVETKLAKAAAIAPGRLQALTNYARCMRSRDINMLDPDQYGALNLGHVAGVSSDFGRYSPQFRQADGACRHLLPPGVHDDGSGP